MKYTIIISVFIVISNSVSFGQNCNADSTFYKQITPELDSLVLMSVLIIF